MPQTPATRWTKENDEQLTAMYNDVQYSIAEIASALRTTPRNIYVRANRLGLHRPSEKSHVRTRDPSSRGPRRIKGGLAARFASILGTKLTADMSEPEVSENELKTWLEAPESFFAWLGVTLFPYQKEGLNLIMSRDRIALVWGRQCGKDTLLALYGLWMAVTHPKSVIVCVSPSQRQSDLWMQTLQSFVFSKRELRDSVIDSSKSELSLVNSSKVYSLPGAGTSGSATIRGFSKVSLLLVNEAAWVPEDTFTAAQPFLAVTGRNAKLILISTPFGQTGYLWRAWNSEVFAKSHATTSDNPLVPKDFLEKEKDTLDALSYAAEYEAQFLSAQNAYFPTELIQRCTSAYLIAEAPLPEYTGLDYYLGADWARVAGADKTVLTVVGIDRDGKGKVLWIKSFDGVDYVTQAGYVMFLDKLWHFKRCYSDASNHAINDLLKSKGLPVEPVQFSLVGKVEMYGRLKAAMEASRLVIPNDRLLIREMSTFEYKISEANNLLLHHVEGGHDDYPDSLALAAYEVTTERNILNPQDALRTAEAMVKLNKAFTDFQFMHTGGTHPDIFCGKCGKWIKGDDREHRHDEVLS